MTFRTLGFICDNSAGSEEAAEDLISCDTKDCLQTSPAIMRGTSEKRKRVRSSGRALTSSGRNQDPLQPLDCNPSVQGCLADV